jgi:hypothetical protein
MIIYKKGTKFEIAFSTTPEGHLIGPNGPITESENARPSCTKMHRRGQLPCSCGGKMWLKEEVIEAEEIVSEEPSTVTEPITSGFVAVVGAQSNGHTNGHMEFDEGMLWGALERR